MPLGNPTYDYDDIVKFGLQAEDGTEEEMTGTVAIIDAHGIFGDNSQVYYDIMVKPDPHYGEGGCLYKHIPEERVSPA